MLICKKCDTEMPDHAVYCMMCGKKLQQADKNQNSVVTVREPFTSFRMENMPLRLHCIIILTRTVIVNAKGVQSNLQRKKMQSPPCLNF